MDTFEKIQSLLQALKDFGAWLGSHDKSTPRSYNHDNGPHVYRTFVGQIDRSHHGPTLLKLGAKPSEAMFAGEFAKMTGQTCERVVFVSATQPFAKPLWMSKDICASYAADRFWTDLAESMFCPGECKTFAYFLRVAASQRRACNEIGAIAARVKELRDPLAAALPEVLKLKVSNRQAFQNTVVDSLAGAIEAMATAYVLGHARDEATAVYRGYFSLLDHGVMLGIANVPSDHVSGSERALLVLVR